MSQLTQIALGPRAEPHNALSVESAQMQLQDCPEMIDHPRHIATAPEREAQAILGASDQVVRQYVRRGIMERWSDERRATTPNQYPSKASPLSDWACQLTRAQAQRAFGEGEGL